MCPVDPRELGQPGGGDGPLILSDRTCPVCEYNLKGLSVGMRCPECGQPIRLLRGTLQENFADAPISYLKNLRFGSGLAFAGFVGSVVLALAYRGAGGWMLASGALAMGVVWWLGVWIISEPRRWSDAQIRSSHERRWLRLLSRTTQAGWVLWTGVHIAQELVTKPSPGTAMLLEVSAWTLSTVALLGLIPLFMLLRDLAHWTSNSDLADHLSLCAWGVGTVGIIVLSSPLIEAVGTRLSGVLALPFAILLLLMPIWTGLFLLVEILIGACLFQLWTTSRWAVRNWAAARAREQRQRKREERSLQDLEGSPASTASVADAVPLAGDLSPGPLADGRQVPARGRIEPYPLADPPPEA